MASLLRIEEISNVDTRERIISSFEEIPNGSYFVAAFTAEYPLFQKINNTEVYVSGTYIFNLKFHPGYVSTVCAFKSGCILWDPNCV